MTTLARAAEFMHGRLLGDDRIFDGISTDTRTLRSGELFVALDGPNFHGSDYLPEAHKKGAAGAVVRDKSADGLPLITVKDTRAALGSLACCWRRQQSAVIVGITGSNGKTTLKEMAALCLAEAGPTLATSGNLNNEIGVPLMLTRIEPTHRYAVIEMGANHAGEIAYLTSLAEPAVVVITNAAAAHLEGFGSIKGVAAAKGEILTGSTRPGVAVLNADDTYFDYWKSLASDIEVLSFGLDSDADFTATDIAVDGAGSSFQLRCGDASVDVRLTLPGRHNIRNACAAAAIASALGIAPEQIQTALEKVRPVAGRLQPLIGLHGSKLYDDSYNANPVSVVAAAEFLTGLDGESLLVLGDMGELGEDSARIHREIGEAVRQAGVNRLYATGELSRYAVEAFGDDARWFDSVNTLIDALPESLAPNVNVLIKGSRFMQMERVVRALAADSGTSEGA